MRHCTLIRHNTTNHHNLPDRLWCFCIPGEPRFAYWQSQYIDNGWRKAGWGTKEKKARGS
jgi:hypothetical protein